jgi:hypothetical protein
MNDANRKAIVGFFSRIRPLALSLRIYGDALNGYDDSANGEIR